jgi:hypothetical protein
MLRPRPRRRSHAAAFSQEYEERHADAGTASVKPSPSESMVGSGTVGFETITSRSGGPPRPSWHAKSLSSAFATVDVPAHNRIGVAGMRPSGINVLHGSAISIH